MKGLPATLFAGLACWAGFQPQQAAWPFFVAVLLFEAWVALRISRTGTASAQVGTPPYEFTDEEAALVGRYRFHFETTGLASECASALGVIGVASMLLVLWLTYKGMPIPAAGIGLNLFAVSRLTRITAPLMPLRMAASKGDPHALRALELYGSAWKKIHAGNARASGEPRG